MKIRCVETNRVTTVKMDDAGRLDIVSAMTRLIRREPEYAQFGHFASTVRPLSDIDDFREYSACRRAEVVRGVGGLTEHTGRFYTFVECD